MFFEKYLYNNGLRSKTQIQYMNIKLKYSYKVFEQGYVTRLVMEFRCCSFCVSSLNC